MPLDLPESGSIPVTSFEARMRDVNEPVETHLISPTAPVVGGRGGSFQSHGEDLTSRERRDIRALPGSRALPSRAIPGSLASEGSRGFDELTYAPLSSPLRRLHLFILR